MKNESKISHVVSATLAAVGLGVIGLASVARADKPNWARDRHPGHRDSDYARVVDVDPIVRRVRIAVPERECWNETQAVPGRPPRTEVRSTIVGGLIGAAVGHRIGAVHASRDPTLIVGGSLIGAAIGNSIGANRADRRGDYRDVEYQTVRQCEVTQRDAWEERVEGYRVTYVYHGRQYVTRMPYDPGDRMRVDVKVRPEIARRY